MTDKEQFKAEIEKVKLIIQSNRAQGAFVEGYLIGQESVLEHFENFVNSLQEEPVATKVLKDMLNAKTAAESLGISQEEHDRIVDECIYGKESELVDADDLPKEKPVSEIDFEQELYKAFGHVKDFTLGMRIAKRFYDMGRNHQEPVSDDLEKAAVEAFKQIVDSDKNSFLEIFKAGAKWNFERIEKVLLSEVLPCFMHGGEADEVVAKLEEVLNKKK